VIVAEVGDAITGAYASACKSFGESVDALRKSTVGDAIVPVDDGDRVTLPLGLPSDWRVLVDSRVLAVDAAIVGAGIRGAKIELAGSVLASLPGVEVIDDLAKPLPPQE